MGSSNKVVRATPGKNSKYVNIPLSNSINRGQYLRIKYKQSPKKP